MADTRKPSWIADRKAFPKWVRVEVWQRAGGMCEADGCDSVGKDFDHIKPVSMNGESTLENCRLLCRKCNADKGKWEAKQAALSDKMGGRTGQYARRARRKAKGISGQISKRSFNTKFRKKLDGTVILKELEESNFVRDSDSRNRGGIRPIERFAGQEDEADEDC